MFGIVYKDFFPNDKYSKQLKECLISIANL